MHIYSCLNNLVNILYMHRKFSFSKEFYLRCGIFFVATFLEFTHKGPFIIYCLRGKHFSEKMIWKGGGGDILDMFDL